MRTYNSLSGLFGLFVLTTLCTAGMGVMSFLPFSPSTAAVPTKKIRASHPICTSDAQTLCPKAQTKPYSIKGIRYAPQKHIEYKAEGIASYYGVRDKFHGKPTATGEIFNANYLTAAHKTLPLPCYVKVTNLDNKAVVVLKVNDRGPFCGDRLIDVSEQAAKNLGFYESGTARVKIETLPAASLKLQNSRAPLKKS